MATKTLDVVQPATGWVLEGYLGHIVVSRGPVLSNTACGKTGYGPTVQERPSKVCHACERAVREAEKARRIAAQPTECQGRLF
jgi:hypothetical protein